MKLGKLNKKLMAMVLTAAEIVTVFQIGSTNATAQSTMTQEECKDIVGTYSVNDTVPGYKEYLAAHADASYPDVTNRHTISTSFFWFASTLMSLNIPKRPCVCACTISSTSFMMTAPQRTKEPN